MSITIEKYLANLASYEDKKKVAYHLGSLGRGLRGCDSMPVGELEEILKK